MLRNFDALRSSFPVYSTKQIHVFPSIRSNALPVPRSLCTHQPSGLQYDANAVDRVSRKGMHGTEPGHERNARQTSTICIDGHQRGKPKPMATLRHAAKNGWERLMSLPRVPPDTPVFMRNCDTVSDAGTPTPNSPLTFRHLCEDWRCNCKIRRHVIQYNALNMLKGL